MSLYDDAAATTLALLGEYGQDVTRRSFPVGNYDPTAGTNDAAPTDTTRRGALFDFGAGDTTVRGTLIQAHDKRLLLDATGPVTPQDHFIVGGVEYVIVSVGQVNPAGTPALYDLHLRT